MKTINKMLALESEAMLSESAGMIGVSLVLVAFRSTAPGYQSFSTGVWSKD